MLRHQFELDALASEAVLTQGRLDRAPATIAAGPHAIVDWPGTKPNLGSAGLPALPGYELLGELGRGGMGVVYKARQTELNRLVALKMIRGDALAGKPELAPFRVEAAAVARLQHPNIVPIYQVGAWSGRPFFALEYVDGGNLAQRLAGTPQAPRTVAQVGEVLARAIHYAHECRILHRDLKPANVLLARSDRPEAIALSGGSEVSATYEPTSPTSVWRSSSTPAADATHARANRDGGDPGDAELSGPRGGGRASSRGRSRRRRVRYRRHPL